MRFSFVFWLAIVALAASCSQPVKSLRNDSGRIEILFLGHDSDHHNSAVLMPMLASQLSLEGISLSYTSDPNDLNTANLDNYDALMIYANHDSITSEQETALLKFVEQGKGFIPIHCASWCFRNSDQYVGLVGGQFLKHKTDTFSTEIVKADHPVTQGLESFVTWDETYEHSKIAKDITVLMERVEGEHREPWTWVKSYGNGRVFYTAYGHDDRTWSNPGFHELMKRGILWAVGDEARQKWEAYRKQMPALVYRDAEGIPNYEKRSPGPRYQDPLSPEESAKLIQVPVGFDLELFASEPDIINPIAMEWDERGRLWVIETVDYPNTVLEDRSAGDDRIKICEDTDGDGKADKFTVFAEKLNIPTSLAFVNGGVIISQAPQFLFLKDTDGDDKADVRNVMIEGWGVFDTHAGPSNLRYGYDNNIWGVVGYSGFEGTIAGENREFRQGIYRFKPDVSGFEFLTATSNNTWGLGHTENNDVFASTANNTHSVFMGFTNKALRGVEGVRLNGSAKIDGHYAMHSITDKVRQVDVFGGFTAASGHNFYSARSYPKSFWNNVALVCEPTGHLVHLARIEKKGAGFVEKDGYNLFAGADEWVAPVEAKVGPDGSVWVLDWYNFIIQHNPTPTPDRGGFVGVNGKGNAYENPLRDKSHGRIWRVVHRQAKEYQPIQLSKDDPDELIKALRNDNLFWRMTAQRLLVERGNTDVLQALYDMASDQKLDENGNNYPVVHALWTIDGLGAIAREDKARVVVTSALTHPSAGARKAAIQILSKSGWSEDIVMKYDLLNDKDPNTRLAAINSLAEIASSPTLGETLYKLSLEEDIINDDWLSKALYAVAHQHRKGFLDAFAAANPDYKPASAPGDVNQKSESVDLDDSSWDDFTLPRYVDQALDGFFWFRKVVDVPKDLAGQTAQLSLGPINDSDATWVNGNWVGGTQKKVEEKRLYTIPANVLKPGKNLIAIRVEDIGGPGGIYGKPEDLFLKIGSKKISLAGTWKFQVDRTMRAANQKFFPTTIAELFVDNNPDKKQSNKETAGSNATVIKLKVIKNEMKYDLKEFSVVAGQEVEIVFENPDFMQHNLVITQQGALDIVGKAADKLAQDPKGAEKNYVPDLPEVLFSTKLVNPQQSVSLRFVAPSKTGDYPFVCTFPGHWSIMNGVMKVVPAKSL